MGVSSNEESRVGGLHIAKYHKVGLFSLQGCYWWCTELHSFSIIHVVHFHSCYTRFNFMKWDKIEIPASGEPWWVSSLPTWCHFHSFDVCLACCAADAALYDASSSSLKSTASSQMWAFFVFLWGLSQEHLSLIVLFSLQWHKCLLESLHLWSSDKIAKIWSDLFWKQEMICYNKECKPVCSKQKLVSVRPIFD